MKPSNLTDQPQVGVLVVGNNPANVDTLYSNIVSSRGSKLVADFAFDLKNIISRILKQRPASIIIDDTLSQKQIDWLIWKIRKNNKLRDIAITLVKSSNYDNPASNGVDELVLKEGMTRDRLYNAVMNSMKFRKYSDYYKKYFSRGRGLLSYLN